MMDARSADILVDARRVGRVYGTGAASVVALKDASLRVRVGDRVALIGRSGGGKSTLLHLIAGFDAPTSGTIAWPALGPVPGIRPGGIAMMMQSPSLIPWLTAAENVALPLQLGGRGGSEVAERALEALATFQLDNLADKLPEEMSGGQAQRIALVRATIAEPALLLADEPTGQVDHATARALLDALFAWADRTGAAIVVATHDHAVANRLPAIISMEHGHLATASERLTS
jgi:putative ABC transport system ATP-binding protein/lipoprotein-releasing system ATP-binding protein